MSKFKVGDKVRRTGYTGRDDFRAGDIRTVTLAEGRALHVDGPGGDNWEESFFELVEAEPTSKTKEVDRLVRTANEGYQAARKLRVEYADEVEISQPSGGYVKPQWDITLPTHNFRIKPTPTFEPFDVGQQGRWKVELKGDRLHVGCQSIDATAARIVFTNMCRHGVSSEARDSVGFKAARDNIIVGLGSREYHLSWAEADKILVALEKAGVK